MPICHLYHLENYTKKWEFPINEETFYFITSEFIKPHKGPISWHTEGIPANI